MLVVTYRPLVTYQFREQVLILFTDSHILVSEFAKVDCEEICMARHEAGYYDFRIVL